MIANKRLKKNNSTKAKEKPPRATKTEDTKAPTRAKKPEKVADLKPTITKEESAELKKLVIEQRADLEKGSFVACFTVGRELAKWTLDGAALEKVGEEVGLKRSKLFSWRKVATVYGSKQALIDLSGRRMKNGQPLTLSHVEYLAGIKDEAKRKKFEDAAFAESLDVRGLREKIKAARKPRAAKSVVPAAKAFARKLAKVLEGLKANAAAFAKTTGKLKPDAFSDNLGEIYKGIAKDAAEISDAGKKLNEAANAGLKLQPRPEAGAEPKRAAAADVQALPSAKAANG